MMDITPVNCPNRIVPVREQNCTAPKQLYPIEDSTVSLGKELYPFADSCVPARGQMVRCPRSRTKGIVPVRGQKGKLIVPDRGQINHCLCLSSRTSELKSLFESENFESQILTKTKTEIRNVGI